MRNAIAALIRTHWGLGSKTLAELFIPGADAAALARFAAMERESASAEVAARLFGDANNNVDVRDLCPRIRVPTLVLHREGDSVSPVELGRDLAARIPKSRFVLLPGDAHVPTTGDTHSLVRAIEEFLGGTAVAVERSLGGERNASPRDHHASQVTKGRAVADHPGPPVVATAAPAGGPRRDDDAATDALALISGLEGVTLSRYWVVPGYVRFDETVRQALKDARQQIVAGLNAPARTRENHLIWAPPGSGKTYFVQQVVASLSGPSEYCELNLAASLEEEFVGAMRHLKARAPCLCLVDEIDARPEEPWPYEVLLPLLDANVSEGARLVFVLAGSGGASLAEMKERIMARPKGADLLSRIPAGNEYVVPPMNAGDRLLAALTQVRKAAAARGRVLNMVEKMALYYLVAQPKLANPRQLREAVVRAVERTSSADDRLKYDHLFSAGEVENKSFWLAAGAVAAQLANRYVIVDE